MTDVPRLTSDLEELIKKHEFKGGGSIGIAFEYMVGERMPLALQVRVTDDEGTVLPELPYSLAMRSPCCRSRLRQGGLTLDYDDDFTHCGKCDLPYSWGTSGNLSILSKTRIVSTIGSLARGVSHFWPEVDVLTATLMAGDVVEDIRSSHRHLLHDKAYLKELWNSLETGW